MTQPRFDAEPIERLRQQTLVGLKRNSTIRIISPAHLVEAVYGEHLSMPSNGTEETIKAIKRADLVEFVKQRFAQNILIVGVTGNITAEELGPLLDRGFGALPKRVELTKIADVPPKSSGETYVVDLDVPQSSIIFGQAGLQRSDPDWYTGLVMNYILGGGGFPATYTRNS